MKDLDKILAKAKTTKAKDRLLDTKEAGQIIAKTNFSPIKGTIMKLTAIFIPILAATIWVASIAGSSKPDQQKAIENIQNLENALDLSGDAKYKRLVPILHLSPDELRELGIEYSEKDTAWNVPMESWDNMTSMSWGKKLMDSLGYDISKNFIYRNIEQFTYLFKNKNYDEEMKKSILSFDEFQNDPNKGIFASNLELRSKSKYREGSSFRSIAPYPHNIERNDAFRIANNLTDVTRLLIKNDVDLNLIDYLIVDPDEYYSISNLIPLILPFDIDGYWVEAVAYYVPTPKFVAKLPSRYQEIIKQNYQLTEVLDLDDVDYDEQVTVDQLNFDYSVSGDTLFLTDAENPFYLPIVNLSDKQLENLGIKKSEENYIIPMEMVDYSSYSWQKEKMKELGYEGVNFTVRELVDFGIDKTFDFAFGPENNYKVLSKEEFDSDPNKGIYPISIKMHYGEKGDKKAKGTKTRSPISPNIDEKDGGLFASNTNELFKKITATGKEIKNFKYIAIDTEVNYPVSKLVPLIIPIEDEDHWVNTLAFFVPSEKFVNKLPNKYQEIIKEKYELTDFLDIDNSKIVYNDKGEAIKLDRSVSLQGINLIELNSDELGSIGINKNKDSLLIPYLIELNLDEPIDIDKHNMIIQKFIENDLDTNLRKGYVHAKAMITHREMQNGSFDYGLDWKTEIRSTPVYTNVITNIMDEGVIKQMSQIYAWTDQYPYLTKDSASKKAFSNLVDNYNKLDDWQSKSDIVYSLDENGEPIIKSLLPVRLNIGDKSNLKEGEQHTEITLWYVPTPDFITSLPPRYAEPLMKEFDIAASVEAGEMTISEACEELGGTSYLGICPNGSFALMNMYPLPVRNNLNIMIVSEKQKSVNANIYDINGKFIQKLGKLDLVGGKNERSLNLSKIQSGTYVLSLVDEVGNAVNRTFLKK